MEWKDMWEDHASREAEDFAKLSEGILLAQIEEGRYGCYYNIWRSVADRQNPQVAVPVLLKALRRLESMREIQYDDQNAIHCATALCQLLDIADEERQGLVYGNRLRNVEVFENLFAQNGTLKRK